MTVAFDPFAPLSVDEHAMSNCVGIKDQWHILSPVPPDVPDMSQTAAQSFAPSGYVYKQHWRYCDAKERLLFLVVRYERAANAAPADKQFRPLTFCEHEDGRREWRPKSLPEPRPLYGLDRLARRPEAPVIVTEGEKSADAAGALFPDWVAVTSPNGANSAGKADWARLLGRRVVIWPDADVDLRKGAAYGAAVAQLAIDAGATSAIMVELPSGLPDGWDLADDPPDGFDPVRLLADASVRAPEPPLPLFPDLAPSAPYPVEALGKLLGGAASAIAHKMQVPLAMAAQSVLATAALAAQAHANVTLHYGQARPLSLFFVTVASSGDRKSSADNEALWPVRKREVALREQYAKDYKEWAVDHAAWWSTRPFASFYANIERCGINT